MKIVGLGDSLMQFNDETTYPQEGWLQELSPFLKEGIPIRNFAKNGRSSKSFIDEGRFKEALADIAEGDLVLVSFGHNDEKIEDPTRYLSPKDYEDNLVGMGLKIKEKGAKPILISSFSRLKVADGALKRTHGEYPGAIKRAAARLDAPFIDLEEISFQALSKDLEKASSHYMILKPGEYPNYPDGQDDHTHLQKRGAAYVAGLIAEELKKISVSAPLISGGKES